MKTWSFLFLLAAFIIVAQKPTYAQVGTRITQASLVKVELSSVLHVSCYGDKKGAIDIKVTGGIPPYTYQWSNGATTPYVAGLSAGEYTVIVNDAQKCPDTLTVEVKQPEKLSVQIDSIADILCYGFNRGSIDITVKGGVQPYTYSWSNQTTSEDLRNVPAGEYALLITDAYHCQEIISAEVKQNPLIVRSDEKVQNVDCSGDKTGIINITVSGGVAPYSYRWTSGESTEDLNNLSAGMYTVQVTDIRGCLETYSTKVSEPNPVSIKLEEVRNIYCTGDKSGAIDISIEGGVKPYSCSWNENFATSEDLGGLSAGTYRLVVKDSKNCLKELKQEITEPELVDVKIVLVKNVINFGESNGAVYLDVKGGIPPYRFDWSDGQITKDIINIPANNYTCRITDENKCANAISVNIEQPAMLEIEIKRLEHNICYGEKNGSIDVEIKGGVIPYKFAWSNGDTTEDLSGLAAGTYSLILTDAHGMIKTVKGTIEQPSLLVSGIQSISHNLCFNDRHGIVDINVSGGTPPYSYNWSNGDKTQDIANVSAGNYIVQIIDKNQCVDTLNIAVEQNNMLNVNASEITDPKCFGKAEGSVNISVTGGVAPYEFLWSNGAITPDLTNINAGQYNLKVRDSKGCEKTLDVSIKEPPLLESNIAEITNVKCKDDSTGSISLIVRGGTAPYAFKWNNERETKDNSQIKAGNYNVTITDAKGCINVLNATVEEPAKLSGSIDKVVNINCFGESTGAIDVSVGGGIPPYAYKWSNGVTTQNLTGIEAGDYKLTIKDKNGCETGLQSTVLQNTLLTASVNKLTHVNCFGLSTGAAEIGVKGGVEPYTYKWSNGAKTKNISNVGADNYTLIITDAKSCIAGINLSINEPSEFRGNITEVTHIQCYNDSNAIVLTSFEGGVVPYSYLWNNKQTSKDIDHLKAGKYTLIASDKNGCKYTLETIIEQPTELDLQLISTGDNLCNNEKNGAIDISVKGGVTPYDYTWSDGSKEQDIKNALAGNYSVKVEDANGCNKMLEAKIAEPPMLAIAIDEVKNIPEYGGKEGSISIKVDGGKSPYQYSWSNGSVTQNIKDLVAGNYSVIVKDSYGCRKDLYVSIKQPEEIKITVDSIQHINCYGEKTGYIKTFVQGGVEPYIYSWNNGVSVNELEGAGAGEYTLKITDANKAVKVLKVSLIQPPLFSLEIDSVSPPTCYELNNGVIKTSVKGGTAPYMFAWSNGSVNQNLKDLTSGNYTIKVKDARGCLQEKNITLNKPEPLEVTLLNTEHIQCNGDPKGKVNIAVKGGTAPYQYNWSNGLKEQNLTNVLAGNYTLVVTDAKQCSKTISAVINEPPALLATFSTVKDVSCKGENKGSINTSVTGGTPPYKYLWNNGSSSESILNLIAGKYSVTVTDANGCTNNLSANITEPTVLTGHIVNVIDVSCFGAKEGSIAIDIQGGTLPYQFSWSNGSKDQNLSSMPAGNYHVNVTDKQGCEISLDTAIKEPFQLLASISGVEHIKCFGELMGAIDVSVKGGVEPYRYLWSNGATTQDLLKVSAGKYILKVLDTKGCYNTLTANIEEPLPLILESSSENNRCNGEKAGNIIISVKGGKEPYTYNWSNGEATRDIRNIPAGKYDLTLTDANGCLKTITATVSEPPKLYNNIDAVNHVSCNGESNGAIHISTSGGTAPYSYQWTNGNTQQDLLNVPAGKYSVIIKEGNGCETKLEATITEPALFISNLVSVTHNKCFSDKMGSITINVDGGTKPYSFKWNNNTVTQNLLNIGAGDYTVLVSDANGCNRTIKTTVTEPPKLVLKVDSARNVKCCGDTSGAIFISVTGGIGPYTYLWSHGKTTQDITGLPEGQYTVLVTDMNGCVINTPEEGTTIYEKMIAQGKFISHDILFDVGKSDIKEQSFIEISRIASFMKEHSELRFSIEGHTDSMGDDEGNMVLSKQRAEAVRRGLIKFGIDPERLETKGFGESRPVDTNATVDGRSNNRRVEFIPL